MLHASEAMRNYRASAEELERVQSKKLRRMLRYCFDRVPLYHEWFRAAGMLPDDVRGPDDLRRLPTLTRQLLTRSYPDRILPRGARVGSRMSTSGTTGTPLSIQYSPEFSDVRMALAFRRSWLDGVRPWHRGVSVWTGEGHRRLSQANVMRGSMALGKSLTLWGGDQRLLVLRQLSFFVARGEWTTGARLIQGFRPTVLYARPSHMRRLGLAWKETGAAPQVRIALTSGEFLSKAVRKDLESMFGCTVFDSYGSTELGGLGFECSEHAGTHVNADHFIFEVLKDGGPASPGESGEIVITGLHNDAMPMLRYEQGDRVVLEAEGRCACGSSLPRLRSIQGRLNDGLVTAAGERVAPGAVCGMLEEAFGMRDYQLTQKSHSQVLMKVLIENSSAATLQKVEAYLRGVLGGEVKLEAQVWGEEDMPVKYRPVISEVR